MNRRKRYFLRYVLIIQDALLIIISFIFTYLLRDMIRLYDLRELADFGVYFPYMVMVTIIWLLLLKLFTDFDYLPRVGFSLKQPLFLKLIPVEVFGLALITAILFFIRDRSISRTFLVLFAGINFGIMLIGRHLFLLYFSRLKKSKKYHRNALLVGDRIFMRKFKQAAEGIPELLVEFKTDDTLLHDNIFTVDSATRREFFDRIIDYVKKNVIDEVVLTYSHIDVKDTDYLVDSCNEMGVNVNFVLNFPLASFQKTEIDRLGPYNVLSFQAYDHQPVQRLIKRIFDLVVALCGLFLLVLMLPFVVLGIQLSDPGSVFFKQKRKGKNGRDFYLIKFRTMYTDAEERKKELLQQNEMEGLMFKMKDDPRIFPFGKFLRKSSIDEFPQFFNVVKGEMSVVGTRPPTEGEFNAYAAHHRRRLSISPGITGLWQVSGRNEITDFEEIVKLDTHYIDNWSFWLDLKIVCKTFPVLFRGQ